MADNMCDKFENVFLIEGHDDFDEDDLIFDKFEGKEIDVDDIDWDDMDGLDKELLSKTSISFVDDNLVENTKTHDAPKEQLHTCRNCRKNYKKKAFYQKHIEKCGKL